MKYDYAVIGAGVSGMTSALILAKAGYRVVLVEKAPVTGPLLRGFTRRGLQFDTGFHYSGDLGPGQLLDRLFRFLGMNDELQVYPYDSSGYDRFRCLEGDFEFRFPFGFEALKERLVAAFPGEKRAIDTYLQAVADVRSTCEDFLSESRNDRNLQLSTDNVSLKEFLDRLSHNRLFKGLLSCHSILYGVASDQVPFSHHARVVGSYYQAVYGVKGGGLSLARAFDARLEQTGVRVECGRGVEELLMSPAGDIEGVRLEGGDVLHCRSCVSTIHPQQLIGIVPDGIFRPIYKKRLMRLGESASAWLLFAESSSPLDFLQGANLYLADTPDAYLRPANGPLTQRPIYISAAESHRPDRDRLGFVALCLTPPHQCCEWEGATTGGRSPDYVRLKEETARIMQKRVEDACPEVRGKIVWREISTPLTLKDYGNSPFGSLYGVAHRVGQHNPMAVTRLPGLLLAGQAVVAPGVMGAMISAFNACAGVAGCGQLNEEVKRCC